MVDCFPFLYDTTLSGFDRSMMAGIILIDLRKVFDTIDRGILAS